MKVRETVITLACLVLLGGTSGCDRASAPTYRKPSPIVADFNVLYEIREDDQLEFTIASGPGNSVQAGETWTFEVQIVGEDECEWVHTERVMEAVDRWLSIADHVQMTELDKWPLSDGYLITYEMSGMKGEVEVRITPTAEVVNLYIEGREWPKEE